MSNAMDYIHEEFVERGVDTVTSALEWIMGVKHSKPEDEPEEDE